MLSRKVSILIESHHNRNFHQNRQVVAIINRMALELERMHPRTFANLSLAAPETAPILIDSIGKNLLKPGSITWGKIISFLTISAAFAKAAAGQPEIIQNIIETSQTVLSEEAGTWIELEGSWNALTDHIRPLGSEHLSVIGWLTWMVTFLFAIHWTWLLAEKFGQLISNVL